MKPERWDFRWRLVQVSAEVLGEWVRGLDRPVKVTTAPPDLEVIGLHEVLTGPGGRYTFIVWSATFEPLANDGERLGEDIPMIVIEYST